MVDFLDFNLDKTLEPNGWFLGNRNSPNLRREPSNHSNPHAGSLRTVSDAELFDTHVGRARRICEVVVVNGVDALVLGAFGCGAFRNDPWIVARAYKSVLAEMGGYFDLVEFAIFCAPGRESENLRAFSQMLMEA